MEKAEVIARKKARRLALQALYQWMMSGSEISEIEAQYHAHHDMSKVDEAYFSEVVRFVGAESQTLDDVLLPLLDRPLQQLNPIELTVLRIGVYELRQRIDIPYKVVINEAVRLNREYGAEEGHRYVNGVLDKLAKSLRTDE